MPPAGPECGAVEIDGVGNRGPRQQRSYRVAILQLASVCQIKRREIFLERALDRERYALCGGADIADRQGPGGYRYAGQRDFERNAGIRGSSSAFQLVVPPG